MARYKTYDYAQTVMVMVSLEEQLQAGTLEHTIHYVVERRLDLCGFDQERSNDETGRPGYDPRVLLKVVLLGYARGMLSSRKLEAACRDNIVFMALTCGQRPDHSTIAEFVSGMGEERISSLFSQVLLVCEEEGLLGGTHFAIDGYKLPSNAAKEWSGTHADLRQKHARLRELVRQSVREHRQNDQRPRAQPTRSAERLKRLEQKAARIERFLAENTPRVGRMGKEVQSNVTDNESAKMKSSHGIIQGYNANAMVDAKHQVIVHAQAFGEGDDGAVAEPMLRGAQANLAAAGCGRKVLQKAVVSADTGYFSNRNLEAFAAAKVDAYVPDPQFRQRDPRFANARRHRRPTDRHKQQYQRTQRWFGPQDFKYEAKTQRLICPAGKRLYGTGREVSNAQGYRVSHYKAAKAACLNCALRERCLRNPESGYPRQVRVFHGRVTETLTSRMKEKIDTPKGRAIYSRRLGIVEPVFGNLGAQKGMNRSTLRGTRKVNLQWRLYCLVHNLEKIGHYGTMNN
ncbi:MAG TPA: IS1182 family transposase [Lacunisphaera sp.]|jgi:transposase